MHAEGRRGACRQTASDLGGGEPQAEIPSRWRGRSGRARSSIDSSRSEEAVAVDDGTTEERRAHVDVVVEAEQVAESSRHGGRSAECGRGAG